MSELPEKYLTYGGLVLVAFYNKLPWFVSSVDSILQYKAVVVEVSQTCKLNVCELTKVMLHTVMFILVFITTIVIFSLHRASARKVEISRFVNTGKQLVYRFILNLEFQDVRL